MFKKLLELCSTPDPHRSKIFPLCSDNLHDEAALCETDNERLNVWNGVFDKHPELGGLISAMRCKHTAKCSCLRPFVSLCHMLAWLGSTGLEDRSGFKSKAVDSFRNVELKQGLPICTQQNYGKLEVIDEKEGWAWEKCVELGLYSEARKAFLARSSSFGSLIELLETKKKVKPSDVLAIQRGLFEEFVRIRSLKNSLDFDDNSSSPLDVNSLGHTTAATSKSDTNPIWFTFWADANKAAGEIGSVHQSPAASRVAARHRYAAGMYRARDRHRDTMGAEIAKKLTGEELVEKLRSILYFRTMVHIRLTPTKGLLAAQPTSLSNGDHYLFRARPSSALGGNAVQLANKHCDHVHDCGCGASGLPEFLLLPSDIISSDFEAEIDAIVLVSVQSLSQYGIPNHETIIRKNPRLAAA